MVRRAGLYGSSRAVFLKAQARRGHGAHGPCLTLTLVYSTTLSYNMQIIVKTRSGKSITLEVEETIDNAEIQDNEEYAQLNSAMATTPWTVVPSRNNHGRYTSPCT